MVYENLLEKTRRERDTEKLVLQSTPGTKSMNIRHILIKTQALLKAGRCNLNENPAWLK